MDSALAVHTGMVLLGVLDTPIKQGHPFLTLWETLGRRSNRENEGNVFLKEMDNTIVYRLLA